MSVAMLEGRRLFTKATELPFGGDEEALRRESAERGSTMLRDAILRAKGRAIPERVPPQRPPQIRIYREVAHIPTACPTCGAPSSPKYGVIAHIQHTVAAYYGLDPITMKSSSRSLHVARPRQVAMYLASKLTGQSLPEIGRRFGDRDHTTVIHAIRAVEKRMSEDAEILLDVEVLRDRLGA